LEELASHKTWTEWEEGWGVGLGVGVGVGETLFPETFSAHPENPIARETKSAINAIWRFFRVVTQTSFLQMEIRPIQGFHPLPLARNLRSIMYSHPGFYWPISQGNCFGWETAWCRQIFFAACPAQV